MTNGDCFVVLPENCAEGTLIIGRNAEDEKNINVASEVCFYDIGEVLEGKVKKKTPPKRSSINDSPLKHLAFQTDGGAAVETSGDVVRIILQKPQPGLWGGDFGANERVAVGLTWAAGENEAKDSDCLLGTDIVRYVMS